MSIRCVSLSQGEVKNDASTDMENSKSKNEELVSNNDSNTDADDEVVYVPFEF